VQRHELAGRERASPPEQPQELPSDPHDHYTSNGSRVPVSAKGRQRTSSRDIPEYWRSRASSSPGVASISSAERMWSVKAMRETRSMWSVMRLERDENGMEDGFLAARFVWNESQAVAERERLQGLNADSAVRYVVIEGASSVVYPDDESPPWVADLDWKKRGHERPPDQ
jgi:hypothetical protein